MSRPLTAEMLAAIVATTVHPALFYEGEWSGGFVRLWTGIGPKDWDGKTFTGAGDLLGITPIEETDEVKASGVTLTLTGVRSQDIALALAEPGRNLPGKIWFALMTPEEEIIPDPRIVFRGRMDVVSIDDSVDGATIRVSYENEMITFEKPREVRYTSEEQKRLFPDDLGCDFIVSLQDANFNWGARGPR